jgi:uncharacterized protein
MRSDHDRPAAALPPGAGIGFKPRHLQALLADAEPPAFVEVHAENYMGAGGAPHAWLAAVRARMPVSLHGVGLSLGGRAPPDEAHLDRLARLIERHRPACFSEHLAWSTHDGRFLNDLLPVPYDEASLQRVCRHVDRVQRRLGLRMLLENPSSYFGFRASSIDEPDFLARVVRATGCGLLLDVNNVHVSCHNQRRDAHAYLDALPLEAVGEIHLAGHTVDPDPSAQGADGDGLLIDDHGAPVDAAVWALYARALARTGPVPTLVEWDNRVPGYPLLREQARIADRMLAAAAGGRDRRAA